MHVANSSPRYGPSCASACVHHANTDYYPADVDAMTDEKGQVYGLSLLGEPRGPYELLSILDGENPPELSLGAVLGYKASFLLLILKK